MTNYITKKTPANSPTFASRCLGYIGITMYESVVNGYSEYQSVAPELNGLGTLPDPENGLQYDWQLSLNAGQAEILRNIYIQTSDENKQKINSLEMHFEKAIRTKYSDQAVAERSINYGKKIAHLIFEWSKTDGGHRGYLQNFDKSLVFKERPGCWRPPLYAQTFSHFPLHPYWGKNRTFLASDSQIAAPTFISYDSTPGSKYYDQFRQVFEKNKILTQAEKEAAIWWADDPDETFTPPGHSYYMATIAIRKTNPSLVKCAETYARTGIAVADAFRNCWKWKYQFFSERPNTFIPSSIRNVDFKARHFKSFWEAAQETADSRFYGGIHTPQDNNMGLEKGKEIANNINHLSWKKKAPQNLSNK
jgi:hypothetical protein